MNKDKKFKVYGSGEGKEPEVSVLQSFVPMMDLSEAHLKTAARQSRIITVPQAELIADKFLLNSHYVYLVSGEIANEPVFDIAGEDWSLLPLDSIYGQNDTISAKTDCRVLLIDKAKLDSMLCWDQVAKSLMVELYSERDFDEDREWLQTLLMSNLFHKLPPFNIRDVIDKFDARVVAADEVIVREGETGDECYIIKEGSALVTVFDTVNKNETQVAELKDGKVCEYRIKASDFDIEEPLFDFQLIYGPHLKTIRGKYTGGILYEANAGYAPLAVISSNETCYFRSWQFSSSLEQFDAGVQVFVTGFLVDDLNFD